MRLRGEVDLSAAPELKRTLAAAQTDARLVVVDLRELTFMDSTGLRALLEANDRAKTARGRLILIRGPAIVDRLFAVSGVGDHLEILDLAPAEPPAQAVLHAARAHADSPTSRSRISQPANAASRDAESSTAAA